MNLPFQQCWHNPWHNFLALSQPNRPNVSTEQLIWTGKHGGDQGHFDPGFPIGGLWWKYVDAIMGNIGDWPRIRQSVMVTSIMDLSLTGIQIDYFYISLRWLFHGQQIDATITLINSQGAPLCWHNGPNTARAASARTGTRFWSAGEGQRIGWFESSTLSWFKSSTF